MNERYSCSILKFVSLSYCCFLLYVLTDLWPWLPFFLMKSVVCVIFSDMDVSFTHFNLSVFFLLMSFLVLWLFWTQECFWKTFYVSVNDIFHNLVIFNWSKLNNFNSCVHMLYVSTFLQHATTWMPVPLRE